MISELVRPLLKENAIVFFVAIFVLAGCSPQYNWREVMVADGHVRAAFPDRVITETRAVTLHGHDLDFSLTTAEVAGAVFAVGYAPLSSELLQDHVARLELGHALMRGLYVSLGATQPDSLEDYGQDIKVHGKLGDQPSWLMARVWVTDTMLIEAVASGTEKTLPYQRAREFVHSVVVKR